MASSLRILKTGTKLSVPAHFRCPISLDLMNDPVTLSTGITYDRHNIETWLDHNRTCPVTNQILSGFELTPNHTIRKMIQAWCVANRSHGIERIPTPRAPITPIQVLEILGKVELASSRHDRVQFLDLVEKIKNLAKDSERSRRCISSNGSARVLAASFREFASDGGVCSEIMSALTCMFPLGDDVCRQFETPEALRSIVSILRSGDLAGRLNAVMVVKEMAADRKRAAALAETEGLVEAIAKMIEEQISPRATKTALVAAYYLVLASQEAASRFVDSGLVGSVLEILVGCDDKSVGEKALGVLDAILGSEKGREEACDHALTMPVLVKKMFRVSDMATEFAVSGIWKLLLKTKCGEERRMVLGEVAVSVGAFQKLLLLLQVGCGEGTKEKASQSLRVLNGCRRNVECFDSMDFRGIKRNI